jgi:DNA-directed RNA polymerase beta' subunit
MMAQEVVIKPGKTIRFNLSINKSFNADFDGDEMNIHVPASLESEAELRLLSASKYKIISSQSSKPNFNICQDSLLGAFRMTLGTQQVPKDIFFNIAFNIGVPVDRMHRKIQLIRRVLKDNDKKVQCFNGKGLVSLILPDDLFYIYRNGANADEPVVKIFRGVLYEGTLDKNTLGSVHNSLIQIIHKDYGADKAGEFIDSIIFLTNQWLLQDGFSIGLNDCMVQGEDKVQEINHVISSCYIEAEGIKQTTHNPLIREARITGALSKAKDMGLKIAKNALQPSNNFISTVKSGAKGDFFNIAQITGLLGQQNVSGKRVAYTLNNSSRSLPHYPFSGLDIDEEYESHGFIDSSFIKGLNPKQYYFHSMSGRESTCDTSMNTSTSGYIQRRIIKLIEDIKIQYDGTVRDVVNSIYQLNFNEDGGFDPKKLVKLPNKTLSFVNTFNIIERLNSKVELAFNKKTLV